MAKTHGNFVYDDSSESEDDSSDDNVGIQPQQLKPGTKNNENGPASNNTVIKSNNPKIHPTISSIPLKSATSNLNTKKQIIETSTEDETDSTDDDGIQPTVTKLPAKNNINGKASNNSISGTAPKIHSAITPMPLRTPNLQNNKTVATVLPSSSEDDESDSTDEDGGGKIATTKPQSKVTNVIAKTTPAPVSAKLNNVKINETSDESDDTSDTSEESDKTSSEDDDEDASDEEEEEDETDDEPIVPTKTAQVVKKLETTVLPSSNATKFNYTNNDAADDSDEDYTSSEDEVFVSKKPLTKPKPFETDSDSDDPDYSDDSSEGEIPLKNNQTLSSKKVVEQKETVIQQPPKPQPRITKPFQNTFTHVQTATTVTQVSKSTATVSQFTKATATVFQTAKQQQPSATIHQAIKPTKVLQQPEDKLLLNALQEFSLNLSNPEARQKELERRAEEALRRNEVTFVCCVCMENFYRDANFVKCKKLNGEKTKKDHYICITCLRGTATPENAGIVADGSGLRCPFPECPNILLMSEIHGMIDAGVESNLLELIGRMSLAFADIGILVICPNCQKQWVIEDKGKPSYVCECKRNNCLFCEREYDKFHEGRNCQEATAAAALEQRTRRQNEVALEMNNIIVRVCHKCGLQFVKSDGCNKMTCRCTATQCYICRARDIDYGHFGGPCQLYDNAEAYDQQRLDEVIARNNNAAPM